MKDIEVSIRLRNNRLKERRDKLKLSQHQLCRLAGVSLSTVGDYEGFRRLPVDPRGLWRKCAVALADFFECTTADLFPEAAFKVKNAMAVRKVDYDELRSRLIAGEDPIALGPDVDLERKEIKRLIGGVVGLLPPRHATIVRHVNGLDGAREMTLEETGAVVGVGKERVRQINDSFLRKLMHPKYSKKLREATGRDVPDDWPPRES